MRRLAALSALLGWMAAGLRGGEVDLLAELEAAARQAGIDLGLPAWDVSGGLEVGAGYRDNVTLSAFEPDSSALLRARGDVLAWRLPANGFEWVSVVDATFSRYFSADTDDAVLVIARSEPRWQWREGVELRLAGQYVYQDEVIDASTLESGLGSALAVLDSYALEPAIHWSVRPGWELRVRGAARYDDFAPPLDDYREQRGEVGLVRELGRGGSVTLALGHLRRDYLDRRQATIGGNPIAGTRLEVRQNDAELAYALKGGQARPWDLKIEASYAQNRDNGEGWYDYDRRVVSLAGSIEGSGWRLEADVGYRRYDYLVQRAGFGDPPRRKRENWSGSVRVERDLSDSLALFVEMERDDSNSNDPFIVYDDVTALVGLRWIR